VNEAANWMAFIQKAAGDLDLNCPYDPLCVWHFARAAAARATYPESAAAIANGGPASPGGNGHPIVTSRLSGSWPHWRGKILGGMTSKYCRAE
jgi:hypothetical protein